MPMYLFLCQLCYTIVHYGEKHPCFFYKNHDTVYTIPQLDESEEMDTNHDVTMEEHTGNSNDNYGNIWAAAQQKGDEESYETNTLLIENNEQISLMPASRRRRNYCSLFADNPNNTPCDISHDASLSNSIFSARECEINSKENASFQALSESFEPDTIFESVFRRMHKTKFSTTGYIHERNKCRSNVSESSEKYESLSDERNCCSLNSGKEFYSDSIEGASQKNFSNSKNISDASTSFINNTLSLGNKELDKKLFDVSRDLTGRPISPEVTLNVQSRNGDEDATVKQHLEFMKDADSAAGPSTILPDSIRPDEKRPHACYLYPKMFKQESHLVSHLHIHTGNKPFICDICGKEFTQEGNFDTHYRTHTGEKPFECDICRKEFTNKGNLGKHYKIHTGEKPFVCDICGKGFIHKGHLNTHYRIHTGEKPYACNNCGEGLSTRSSLKRHIPTHEGGKHYKCGVCGKTFSCNDNRNRHYKEKHQ